MLDNVKVNKWAMNAEVNTLPCRGVGEFDSVDRFEHGSPGFEPGLSLSRYHWVNVLTQLVHSLHTGVKIVT